MTSNTDSFITCTTGFVDVHELGSLTRVSDSRYVENRLHWRVLGRERATTTGGKEKFGIANYGRKYFERYRLHFTETINTFLILFWVPQFGDGISFETCVQLMYKKPIKSVFKKVFQLIFELLNCSAVSHVRREIDEDRCCIVWFGCRDFRYAAKLEKRLLGSFQVSLRK